jgi:hypothetical protein
MYSIELRKIKQGEVFKRKPDAKGLFVKGDYDRGTKSFSCSDYNDMNRELFIKSTKLVWLGFEY